ncbi:MAG: TauD/TfdA family dioxygenase [Rhodospirillales bacterium]
MTDSLALRPLSPKLGVEVLDLDLKQVDGALFAALHEALVIHSALLLRDQSLSHADLLAFSRRFGRLDRPPVMERGRTAVEGYPEIYVISNIAGPDGAPIGSLGAGEADWHTDMSHLPVPPFVSLLYAHEVPPSGGDTWLSSMKAAYAALPEPLRREIQGLSIKHDGTYNSGGFLRAGERQSDDPRDSVGQPHPIVCAHPESGEPVLYLGRRRNAYVIGMELAQSEALLDRLWSYAVDPAHSLAHAWRVGDVLAWDNRATLHRRDAFDPQSRRLLTRTQVKGSRAPAAYGPTAAAPA